MTETPEELAARKRRHNTWIAVAIILVGTIVLGGIIWWQQTRHDEYGRDVGCALAEVRGDDCDD